MIKSITTTTKVVAAVTSDTMATTTPSTTTTAMTTTATSVTVTSTQEPTARPNTLPLEPGSTLPPNRASTSAVAPEVTTDREEGTDADVLISVTRSNSEDAAVTPIAAAELIPVNMADIISGALDPVMPLAIPDSSTLQVIMDSPPSSTQETKRALSLRETPTLGLSSFSVSTTFALGEPGVSEPPLYLDVTQTTTMFLTQQSQTETASPDAHPKVLFWQKELDSHAKDAVQSDNDTATFSAATVLSGDGEFGQNYPLYPQLQDTDSELHYHYDPANGFILVSSATFILFSSPSYFLFFFHFLNREQPSPLCRVWVKVNGTYVCLGVNNRVMMTPMAAGVPQHVLVWRRSMVFLCSPSVWKERLLYWHATCTSIRYNG